MKEKRVAVIGLDGMAWHVLDRLFECGAMPNLKRLVDNSIRGILKSTIPPVTPPAWTNIATGVNPGKHGIFDFLTLLSNYKTRIVSSFDVRYPRLHEMLALREMTAVCINQPLTYPIIRIKNTFIISDWLAPKLDVFPKFLEKYVKTYRPYTPKHVATERLSAMYADCERRVDAVNNAMEKLDWNLFWVIYSEPDQILHRYYNQIMKGREHFTRFFNKIDESIGLASKLADLVFVVSDHGFSEYKYSVNVNCFLDEIGLVAKTWTKVTAGFSDFLPGREKKVKTIKLPNEIHKIVLDKPFLKSIIKTIYKKLFGKELTASCPYVATQLSKAFMYSPSSFGIYVREEAFIEFILSNLKKLEYITQAWKREQIFHGPYTIKAPHIIFEPNFNKGYTIAWSTRITPKILSSGKIFDHHPEGIIIAWGNDVSSTQIGEVKTCDLVPTILSYLGLPLPIDTDGKVISEIVTSSKRYYNYLLDWLLIRNVQVKKSKLTLCIKNAEITKFKN